jgi:hypothetical protein
MTNSYVHQVLNPQASGFYSVKDHSFNIPSSTLDLRTDSNSNRTPATNNATPTTPQTIVASGVETDSNSTPFNVAAICWPVRTAVRYRSMAMIKHSAEQATKKMPMVRSCFISITRWYDRNTEKPTTTSHPRLFFVLKRKIQFDLIFWPRFSVDFDIRINEVIQRCPRRLGR